MGERVYFVTNRNPNRQKNPTGFGKDFNSVSPDSLRFGHADVTGNKVSDVWVADERIGPKRKRQVHGSDTVFDSLKEVMAGGCDTVCLVHGYKTSFKESLVHGAELARSWSTHKRRIVPLVFSWPSDGKMTPFLAYKRDRDDAMASGFALARAMLKLGAFLHKIKRGEECGARLHLAAHSMGNYVLRHGVQAMVRSAGTVPRLFDQVLLIAADEDHDALELGHKLAALPDLGDGVSVYFNRDDSALVVSDYTKNNPTRLGSRGPRTPLNVPGNVTLVEVTEVAALLADTFGHTYHVGNPSVIADIKRVLAHKPADQFSKRRYVPSQNRYVIEAN